MSRLLSDEGELELATLLELTTKAACSHVSVIAAELVRAVCAADHLLSTARRLGAS